MYIGAYFEMYISLQILVNNSNSSAEQNGYCFCPQGSAGKAQTLGRRCEEGCDKLSTRKSEVIYHPAKKPPLSNVGLKFIPDVRHLRRKRCNGELRGKKITRKTTLSSEVWRGLIEGFLYPFCPTSRLYVELSFYNLFK